MKHATKIVIAGLLLLVLPHSVSARDWGKVTVASDDKRHTFSVELALSPSEQARGMMGRPALGPEEGMLFIYKSAEPRSFWMKNVSFPLDIIYIDIDGRIESIVLAQPNDETSRPSKGPAMAVLEIAGGRAEELGIKVGDLVEHPGFRFAQKNAAK